MISIETATCTVTGKGNYTGTISVDYSIFLSIQKTRHTMSFSCSGVGSGSTTKTIPSDATDISASGTVSYLYNYGYSEIISINIGNGSTTATIPGSYVLSADFYITSNIGTGSIKCKFSATNHPDHSIKMSGEIVYYTY